MELWRPDPTFYPSPKMAMQAPPETVAFVAMLNAENDGRPDALGVVDVNPASSSYGTMVGRVDMLDVEPAVDHWKARGLDMSVLLYNPPVPARVARRWLQPRRPAS